MVCIIWVINEYNLKNDRSILNNLVTWINKYKGHICIDMKTMSLNINKSKCHIEVVRVLRSLNLSAKYSIVVIELKLSG